MLGKCSQERKMRSLSTIWSIRTGYWANNRSDVENRHSLSTTVSEYLLSGFCRSLSAQWVTNRHGNEWHKSAYVKIIEKWPEHSLSDHWAPMSGVSEHLLRIKSTPMSSHEKWMSDFRSLSMDLRRNIHGVTVVVSEHLLSAVVSRHWAHSEL